MSLTNGQSYIDSQWKPAKKSQQTHGPYRLEQSVLAVMPPDDLTEVRRDEQEVVTIRAFHRNASGIMRVRVEDSDGVGTWIDADMIVRPARPIAAGQ